MSKFKIGKINRGFKKDYFEKIDSRKKAYWLGYLYNTADINRDGTVVIRGTYTTGLSHIVRFQNNTGLKTPILQENMHITQYREKRRNHYIAFKCKEFTDGFYSYMKEGVVSENNDNRYPNISPEFNSDFIRGLFESSSEIIDNGKRIIIRIRVRKKLAQKIQILLKDEVGMHAHVRRRRSGHEMYVVEIQSKVALPDFILYMYDDVREYDKHKYSQLMRLFEKHYN